MSYIIFSEKITDMQGNQLSRHLLKETFLSGLVDMYKKIKKGTVKYGLVHGNGGLGEMQGVVILENKSLS